MGVLQIVFNLFVKNGIHLFYIKYTIIYDIQKPTLGNDMFCTCFKQCGVRSNHCLKHMQNISFPRVGF